MNRDDETAWHLDKRVPLAIIFAMAGQVVAVVWAVSRLYSDVGIAIETNAKQDARLSVIEATTQAQAVSNATLNAQLASVISAVGELKAAQKESTDLLRQYLTERGRP